MKLISLSLENFQGLKSFSITPDGRSITIYGPNGSGKSTVASSISWLLTGKSASGEKGYSPKPLDTDGREIHNLETSAEAVFSVDGGTLTLRKILRENWRKRKSGGMEFTGNTIAYYVNGEPTTETIYRRTLQDYFTPDESMMLTIPSYFAEELSWTDRRRILLQISGGITDSDVIASDTALAAVPDILKEAGTDDASAALLSLQRKEKDIREQKAAMLPRIDEAAHAIPDVSALDIDALKKEEEKEAMLRNSLSAKNASLSDDTAKAETQKKLAAIETEYAEKQAAYARNASLAAADAEKAFQEADALFRESRAALAGITEKLDTAGEELRKAESRRISLLEGFRAAESELEAARNDNGHGEDCICPACGQRLPEDIIKERRKGHEKERNDRISAIESRLEDIRRNGKASADTIDALKERISELGAEKTAAEEELAGRAEKRKAAMEAVPVPRPFSETEEAKRLEGEAEALKSGLRSSSLSVTEAGKAIDEEIGQSLARSREIASRMALFSVKEMQEKRIEELETEKKRLEDLSTKALSDIAALQLFIRRRAEMLDERISSMFHGVRFRLTEVLINGAVAECCEPIVQARSGWIPYSQASNAERINGGIEIIRVLSESLGKMMPVVIDNAESVIAMKEPMGMQLIRLYVRDTASGTLECA